MSIGPIDLPLTGSIDTDCPNCGGTKTVTETRSLWLDELSDGQLSILFESEMYRETGGEETQQQADRIEQQVQSTPGAPSDVHVPNQSQF